MKYANLTEEEKQRIMESAAMPPVIHSGLMYSRRSVDKLTKQKWKPRGEKFNASEAGRFLAEAGSGSRPTEAAASSSDTAARVQVFPERADETPILPWERGHITEDYLTQRWWMSDEDRLTPWLWLDLLNNYMSLPRDACWVDHLLFYTPPDGHELRPIPETYSWQSLKGYKKERDQKR